jgi:hypothetical protein
LPSLFLSSHLLHIPSNCFLRFKYLLRAFSNVIPTPVVSVGR